ncbi:DUF6906 family protein [Brevibacillus thermoruber]|uniref:DUF6906 family protein n=1 Tax=Brevibacillus thermoruber TaxID=33942 RepID=UPI003A5C45C7
MKNGKNLTRTQKLVLLSRDLNPKEWLLSKKLPDMWLLVHRRTNQTLALSLNSSSDAS